MSKPGLVMQKKKTENTSFPLRAELWAVALSAIVGFVLVWVYVTSTPKSNVAEGALTKAEVNGGAPAAQKAEGSASGRLAAFVRKKTPEPLADVSFTDGSGNSKSLSDFRGKTVLLNLWATWCAPCREEMPSLDRLQQELGSEKFEVVALALERGGAKPAQKFLDEIKASNLALYVDKSTRAGSKLRVLGMPTTILVDAQGREIGRLSGPAEWDTPEAKKLVSAALD